MIDCLSNPEWIKPQMDFLIYLQNVRINCPEFIDKFFLSITIFGEFWLPTLMCAIVYWCIDFKAGIYLFSLESFNKIFVHLFKMIACVYRPWILDNRIHPSELAIPFAKGYSFPSGHSSMSSSVLGGCAYLIKKHKILSTLLIIIVLLVGFSRLWLGVHSLQDVICGLAIGFTLVFVVNPLIKWAEKDKNRYLMLLLIINVFTIAATTYIYFFNTYRIDYVLGNLLVDPQSQKYNTIVIFGYSMGVINGCYLCARYFAYNPKEMSLRKRITVGTIGSIGIIALLKFALKQIVMGNMPISCATSLTFIIGITITLIYPVIFTRLWKNNKVS